MRSGEATETEVISGEWWTPEPPNGRSAGILSIRVDGTLVLDSPDGISLADSRAEEIPLILGMSREGQPITLIDSVNCFRELPEQTPRSLLWPDHALLGAHFASKSEVVSRQAQLQLVGLREWLGRQIIEFKGGESSWTYTVRHSDPIKVSCDAGEFAIWSGADGKHGWWSLELRAKVGVQITAAQPLGIAEWHERYFRPLQTFVSLATTHPSEITRVDLVLNDPSDATGRDQIIEVVGRPSRARTPFAPAESRAGQMLFTYDDVKSRLADVLQRWLSASIPLRGVLAPFFSTMYLQGLYVEQRFLSLVRAVEAYHRSETREPRVPDTEWKKIRRSATAAVPDAHQERVRELLLYGNDPTFDERMSEVTASLEPIFEEYGLDRTKALKAIKKARNGLVHGLAGKTDRNTEPELLIACSDLLEFVVQASLLQELGFSPTEAARRVTAAEGFRVARRRWEGFREDLSL